MSEVREEIDHMVSVLNENMPIVVKDAIRNCNADLYFGPLYLDKEGEHCSMFDDGATPFNFREGCNVIRDYCDTIEDIVMIEYRYNDEGEEIEVMESIDGTCTEIVKGILGKELYNVVY